MANDARGEIIKLVIELTKSEYQPGREGSQGSREHLYSSSPRPDSDSHTLH